VGSKSNAVMGCNRMKKKLGKWSTKGHLMKTVYPRKKGQVGASIRKFLSEIDNPRGKERKGRGVGVPLSSS